MDNIRPELGHLAVDINAVTPYPGNPNCGDQDAIAESLQVNGQYRPIVVNAVNGNILAGNTTYASAMSLGWDRIAVSWVTVEDPAEEARIVAVDNRAARLAVMDNGLLLELLGGLPDLLGTGYEPGDVKRLQASVEVPLSFPEPAPMAAGCPFCGSASAPLA